MSGLVVREWRRYGQDRLYVNDASSAETVAEYDRLTGKIHVVDEARREEALKALRPFLAGSLPARVAQQLLVAPPLPGQDLTENKAGAAVSARARELGPRGFQRLAARLLRLRTEATSWEIGAQGERIVGKRLARLERDGWGVLPSVTLRSGADIDHVVIGPPGVFTINTKHHKGARVRVGDHVVWVNNFEQRHYIRNSRHEAQSAARRLSRACGTAVNVHPVLAFVGTAELKVVSTGAGVIASRGEDIDRVLRSMPGVLTIREREHLLSVARDAALWLA